MNIIHYSNCPECKKSIDLSYTVSGKKYSEIEIGICPWCEATIVMIDFPYQFNGNFGRQLFSNREKYSLNNIKHFNYFREIKKDERKCCQQ